MKSTQNNRKFSDSFSHKQEIDTLYIINCFSEYVFLKQMTYIYFCKGSYCIGEENIPTVHFYSTPLPFHSCQLENKSHDREVI